MKNPTAVFTALLIAVLLVPRAHAQDEEPTETEITTAKKREGVAYYMAIYVDFKEGQVQKGINFIKEHFAPVDEEVGHEVISFNPVTGPWDYIAFFRMEEGPEALAWEVSPSGAEWNTAFLERTGGMDNAMKLFEEFQGLIENSQNELVLRPTDM